MEPARWEQTLGMGTIALEYINIVYHNTYVVRSFSIGRTLYDTFVALEPIAEGKKIEWALALISILFVSGFGVY